VPLIFSESRRRSVYIVVYRSVHPYPYFLVHSCIKTCATIIILFCSNNDYTEFNTCNLMPVVTDHYDILSTTNMGMYLWIVIHL
jgi:hypothetical protein